MAWRRDGFGPPGARSEPTARTHQSSRELPPHNTCEGRRVTGDVLDSLDQVFGGGVGPDYPVSHLERRFLTSP